jgi:pimeloyl-ACP methyl ester carboxylesterase
MRVTKTRLSFGFVVGGLVVGLSHFAPTVDASSSSELRCEEVLFPVALAPGQPEDFTVVTELCSRGPIANKTIQVLVHGATYDHFYWDWPFLPATYSWVRAATAEGYATLNMDRLGHGQSTRVSDGSILDLPAGAFAVHQIIQELRSGDLVTEEFGRVRARRVLLVGESIGGYLAWLEAGTYHDVDGLIVASAAHGFGPGFDLVIQNTVPVETDPLLAPRGFPPNYFTTRIGTRGLLFYYEPNTNPINIFLDELLKQTITIGESLSAVAAAPVSQQVNVPTLIVVGDFDFLFCSPPSCTASGSIDDEPDNFGPGSCAELEIVPNAGHNLNLHRNAPEVFDLVHAWADRRIGASALAPPPQPCSE